MIKPGRTGIALRSFPVERVHTTYAFLVCYDLIVFDAGSQVTGFLRKYDSLAM